jgi:hypothetical protein
MTNQEFLDRFYLDYDRVVNLSAPGYLAAEVSTIANEALEDLITTKVNPKSNRLQVGFEETEKRVQEIGELVRYKNITVFTAGFFDNGYVVVLPNTLRDVTNAQTGSAAGPTNFDDVYWYTIYEEVVTNELDCSIAGNTTVYEKALVIETTHGELPHMLRDPFNKPSSKPGNFKVLRLRSEGRKHEIITDGTFAPTRYKIGYIRKPRPIDLTGVATNQVCELSDPFHRELLAETVRRAAKQAENMQRLQVEQQQIKE